MFVYFDKISLTNLKKFERSPTDDRPSSNLTQVRPMSELGSNMTQGEQGEQKMMFEPRSTPGRPWVERGSTQGRTW